VINRLINMIEQLEAIFFKKLINRNLLRSSLFIVFIYLQS